MSSVTASTFTRISPRQVERQCEHCKTSFWCYTGRVGRFCSRPCAKVYFKNKKPKPRTDPQTCSRCKNSFPLADYPINKQGQPTLRCAKCMQPTVEAKRRSHLWTKFKISLEDWIALYQSQDGRCPICTIQLPGLEELQEVVDRATPWKWRNWNTDHCHKTGKVRGILCRTCNMGLGAFKENVETFKAAIKYVKKHSSE